MERGDEWERRTEREKTSQKVGGKERKLVIEKIRLRECDRDGTRGEMKETYDRKRRNNKGDKYKNRVRRRERIANEDAIKRETDKQIFRLQVFPFILKHFCSSLLIGNLPTKIRQKQLKILCILFMTKY